MTDHRANGDVPPLVRQALTLAEEMHFTQSCTPEVGRLLAVLATQRREGTVGELRAELDGAAPAGRHTSLADWLRLV